MATTPTTSRRAASSNETTPKIKRMTLETRVKESERIRKWCSND